MVHWHKNLEDLYFLRDRIPSIPEHVAALLPHTLDDSRRMFAQGHRRGARDAEPCHPAAPGPRDPRLHRELHGRLRLGELAASLEPRAWDGFPERPAPSRRERMIELFAEEGMVIAAERRLLSPAIEGDLHSEAELTRWALRALITRSMPENLRYFGVNYYREIAARIPRGWMSAIEDMEHLRPACASPGAGGSLCDAEKAPR